MDNPPLTFKSYEDLVLSARNRFAPSGDHHGRQRTQVSTSSQRVATNVGAKSKPVSVQKRLDVLEGMAGGRVAYLNAGSGKTVTWSEAAKQAHAWTKLLPPGTVVALHAKDPVEFCRSYLAGLAAGLCIAPLDPRATAVEVAKTLDVLEVADVVVDSEDTSADLSGWGLNIWISSDNGLRLIEQGTIPRLPAPGIAVLLPTSGTTGRPKLVLLTEGQLLRVAARIAKHHELTPQSRGYSPLPLFHVNAQVVGILSTLVAGSSLVVEDRFHGSSFWDAAEAFEVDWLNLVPAILAILADGATPPAAVSLRTRFARSASAPLPVAVLLRFESKSGIGVLETYGMTEAASQIASNPLSFAERRPGSVGRANGVRLRIVDEERRELRTGETGVVEIRGGNVIGSYLNSGRTRISARESDGWLRTDDLARRDSRGFIYLAGRKDDVINRGGEKFHPREIEEVLLRDRRIRSAAAIGRPQQLLGEEPVAYVVANGELTDLSRSVLIDELLEQCRHALSPHKRPSRVVVVGALPTGPTGKLDRRALRSLDNEQATPMRKDRRELLPVEMAGRSMKKKGRMCVPLR